MEEIIDKFSETGWWMCTTCEKGFSQPFFHCSECGEHTPSTHHKCSVCGLPKSAGVLSVPQERYKGRTYECLYGMRVTPKECKEGQLRVSRASLCRDCRHSADTVQRQQRVPF